MNILSGLDVAAGGAIRVTDLVMPEGLVVTGDFSLELCIKTVRQDCLECGLALRETNGVWENFLVTVFDDVFPDHLWEFFSLDALELLRAKNPQELLRDFLSAVISREGKFDLALEEDETGEKMLEISVTLYEGTPKRFETSAKLPLDKAKAAGMKISVNGEEL